MELNSEQRHAIDHEKGPLLVLAGAGSGKTRIVTERIAKLLSKGVLPSQILAVTFTNKAAEEMKRRVEEKTSQLVLCSTFHSLGARILRESIETLGFRKDFSIYDEEDSEKLLSSCFEKLSVKQEKAEVKKMRAKIAQAKNNLLLPQDITLPRFPSQEETLFSSLYPLYQTKLKESNAVDFEDLLFLCVQLLQNYPSWRELYQQRWQFVLIDEYQDTNFAQYSLSKILVAHHQNLFAVGDPDQSIYSWRGARYKTILDFDKDFPQAKILRLEQNYRSCQTILKASNALIQNNLERYEKNLWSTLGEGEKIALSLYPNEYEEAQATIEKLLEYHYKEKIPFEEMAIFYRTNSQSRLFEDVLLKKKIPYVIWGGISFYQRKEIKDVLSFLKMTFSDQDFLAFSRTLFLPKRGIGNSTLSKLKEIAERKNLSFLDSCDTLLQGEYSLASKQKSGLKNYKDLVLELRKNLLSETSLSSFLENLLLKTHYMDSLKEDPETFEDRKENLEAFVLKAFEWEKGKEALSLSQKLVAFLEEIALLASFKEQGRNSQVKLMTLHNSKGLEFMAVFIVGCEEGLCPHRNSLEKGEESIEEERRLFYVGMTRAKKKLSLSRVLQRTLFGASRSMKASRFVEEIPSIYLQKFSFFSSFSRDFSARRLKAF